IGGINLPKVIECLGSDGQIYKQLVKGSDDLRQDAVLSKIFTLVNVLLNRDQSTRKKQLSIRTYHIIPLSPRSGIIEWVKNTIPFGTYLTEAHPKYNKNDIMPLECRMMLHNEQQKKNSTPKSKLAVYNSIEAQFKPVFRYFFQERFKDPFDWYNKKISYTKSVSVNSVTGWVVGLGDRHCMNILIDLNTAEAIHIDLGIAFDAGKLLSIPECIPFRLTRDVVDGMGINKVEGVFRKSCEDTLKVLRTNSNVLLTILDVFRYDPLYNW
ncbi:kinase-like protein, partial [Neocallimastix californiae]